MFISQRISLSRALVLSFYKKKQNNLKKARNLQKSTLYL